MTSDCYIQPGWRGTRPRVERTDFSDTDTSIVFKAEAEVAVEHDQIIIDPSNLSVSFVFHSISD